jgi:hypothetical protein
MWLTVDFQYLIHESKYYHMITRTLMCGYVHVSRASDSRRLSLQSEKTFKESQRRFQNPDDSTKVQELMQQVRFKCFILCF